MQHARWEAIRSSNQWYIKTTSKEIEKLRSSCHAAPVLHVYDPPHGFAEDDPLRMQYGFSWYECTLCDESCDTISAVKKKRKKQ